MSDEQYKKDNFIKKKNFSIKAIDLLKENILKIDPSKIIIDALSSANSQSNDKSQRKNELLEQTKKNAINSFFSNIDNNEKNIEIIKNSYTKELKDFTNSTQLLAERANKETKEYISKFEVLNKENKMIKQRYLDIRNQYKDLNIQQNNSLSQISQMKKRDNVLTANKPVLKDFLKQFKNQAPRKIIEDIEKQKDGFKTISKEYNNIINKIIFERKLFEIQYKRNNDFISNTNNKIHNLEEENALIQKNFENEVNDLQREIRNLQGLKEDNDKYRKMLYQLYNRLIDAYCLDKNIRINKKYFDLNKSDYKPNLLDDNEICKYIKLMISSMNPSTSDQLLRETIAYSNMITRVYLKNKINLKYDPLSTFKELKDIMEKNEEKILQLSNNVKEYEYKINLMAVENKKLNNMINYFHQERNKMIENKQNINSSLNVRRSVDLSIIKDRRHRKVLAHVKKSNESSSSMTSTYNYFFEKNKKRKKSDCLINKKKFKQRRYNINMVLHKNNSITNNLKKLYNTSSINASGEDIFQKYLHQSIDPKDLKNPLFQSLYSMNAKQINKKNSKVSESSPGTKIMKRNTRLNKSQSQSMATYIKQFEQLIDHTNRLFLYQAKIAPKFIKDKNFENLKNQKKKNDINSFIRNNSKNQIGNLLQEFVKTKIVTRINGMINNLENKENEEEDESELIPIK